MDTVVDKICLWTYVSMYRLSVDQMGGTTSIVDVTTNSTVMLSFLHWVIPKYIVLAPTSLVYIVMSIHVLVYVIVFIGIFGFTGRTCYSADCNTGNDEVLPV